MKKIGVLIGLMMALMVSSVIGVTVDCDEPGWLNTDVCRDYELQDEFDAVEDYADAIGVDLEAYSDRNDLRVLAISNQADEDLKIYADTHDASGTSFRRVLEYLENEYITFLKNIFAVDEDVQDRMDYLQAQINLGDDTEFSYRVEQARVKAVRTNTRQEYEGYVCIPNAESCVRFN